MVKSIFSSKTFIANAVAFVAGALAIFGLDLTPENRAQLAEGLALTLPVLNIILRWVTTKAVAFISPGKVITKAEAAKLLVLLAVLVLTTPAYAGSARMDPATWDASTVIAIYALLVGAAVAVWLGVKLWRVLAVAVVAAGLGACTQTTSSARGQLDAGVTAGAVAGVTAGAVAGNVTGPITVLDKADATVAKAADKLARSCGTVALVGTAADVFVSSDTGQAVVDQARSLTDTLCANPPRTVAELFAAAAVAYDAAVKIERARKAGAVQVAAVQ